MGWKIHACADLGDDHGDLTDEKKILQSQIDGHSTV